MRTRAADPMQAALWYTAALTGMRRERSRACAGATLTWPRARPPCSAPGYGGRRRTGLQSRKTARGRRVVSLDPLVVAELRRWRATQLEEFMRYRTAWDDREPTADGKGRPRHSSQHLVRAAGHRVAGIATACRSGPTGCAAPSMRWPRKPLCRRSGCTTCGTRGRRSPSRPTLTPRRCPIKLASSTIQHLGDAGHLLARPAGTAGRGHEPRRGARSGGQEGRAVRRRFANGGRERPFEGRTGALRQRRESAGLQGK